MAQAVGIMLQRARERLGLRLSDVAEELGAREIELIALEERSTAGLWTARERALLRVYARRLNVDAEPVLRELPAAEAQGPAASATAAGRWSVPAGHHAQRTPRRVATERPAGPRRRRRALIAATVTLVIAMTVAVAVLTSAFGTPG